MTSKGGFPAIGRWHPWLALIVIAAGEYVAFGPAIGKSGFYLDDWSMWASLTFAPDSWLELLKHCLSDSKVIIRPLEAPYFVLLYKLFGLKPLGYHLVNAVFEVAGAWFLYLALWKLFDSRALALVAALVFLVYPAHDATHYWITASSATVSLTLYTASLWLCVYSVRHGSRRLLAASAFVFAVSVFNYEAFLPLCALNGAAALTLYLREHKLVRALGLAVLVSLPYLVVVLSMWIYQRLVLPAFGIGWNRPVTFDLSNLITVISQGTSATISPYAFGFFADRMTEALSEPLRASAVIGLTVLFVSVAAVIYLQAKHDPACQPAILALVMALGAFTVVVSFTIFGVAANYTPCLDTIMNRINAGASLGAAFIISGVLGLLTLPGAARILRLLSFSCLAGLLIVILALADWGYSKAWLACHQVQTRVWQLIGEKRGAFRKGNSIILANTPRYVMWSPLFDGVWDFQPMARLALGTDAISGGVISERMVVSEHSVKDISCGWLCGEYPFKGMFMLIPGQNRWIAINSAAEFINTVEKDGMGFGLDPKTPFRWRAELSDKHSGRSQSTQCQARGAQPTRRMAQLNYASQAAPAFDESQL